MLGISLIVIIGIFCAIMFGVLAFCQRERKRSLANQADGANSNEIDQAGDTRVALVLLGAIIVGALLALITMYLVFFAKWD